MNKIHKISNATSIPTIAIVGGGFSGAIVAVHLLEHANSPLDIKLIERRNPIGLGVAYSTPFPCHLLNVPVGKMSAFPDLPNHFLYWLQERSPRLENLDATAYVPRFLFGEYVQAILARAESHARTDVTLQRIADEAISIQPHLEGAIVKLQSGKTIRTDKVILALGNFPPSDPAISDRSFYSSKRYISYAWASDAFDDIDRDDPVLLIGSGLTMLDWAIALHDKGHMGKIYVVSRHGLLPNRHQATFPYPPFLDIDLAALNTRTLLKRVRREVEAAATQGHDWRAVIDSLRPITQQIWQALPIEEKRRFLRHVRPYWEVHRHRMAPAISEAIATMRNLHRLVICAGCIQAFREDADGVDVLIRKRSYAESTVIRVGRVINCTGPECDYRKFQHPLIAALFRSGLSRPDLLHLGLDVADNGAILDTQGTASQVLFTLGSPCKGNLWETTAVPEIRQQAAAIARELLALVKTGLS
ncbi:FAD/NAD(P)-binding protein [Pseudanabaena sp. PCC 6802]|uniref:FAD/NAD(P)-binding protein n=1 Tax=Pseudanabaena sp. PCC 6802 TaxID=118173 RepID=UPI00034C2DB8|nr:FAD/NAD(P)-binding protein [Pseudanabaena sp. PCC 6802]